MLAAGKVPAQPLPEVQAYLDHARFGVLPFAGGGFEQPASLMEGLHRVAQIVEKKTDDRHKARAGGGGGKKTRGARKRRKGGR